MLKNNLKIGIIIQLVLWSLMVSAQGGIRGVIKDSKNGQGLQGVEVYIIELKNRTKTGISGEYEIENIAEGVYTIKASCAGYKEDQKFVEVYNDHFTNLDFPMDSIDTKFSPTIITATRTERKEEDIPMRVVVITEDEICHFPMNTIDDILFSVGNISINRDRGFYSGNPEVTMRGMNRSCRTLILFDGIPFNKSGGGYINWNAINPNYIKKVEFIKGTASSLYGNNSIGGVIDLISKHPLDKIQDKKIDGDFKLFYGRYITYGGALTMNANHLRKSKGFYWGVNEFHKISRGYEMVTEKSAGPFDTTTFLQDVILGVTMGYQFSNLSNVELNYHYFYDNAGDGRIIYEKPDGCYRKNNMNFIRLKYNTGKKNYKLNISGWYKTENNYIQQESFSKNNRYRLYESESFYEDEGIIVNYTRDFSKDHRITSGMEYTNGLHDGSLIYRTSWDETYYGGNLSGYAFYLQDEVNLINDKFRILTGVRYDNNLFSRGRYSLWNPSNVSGFSTGLNHEYDKNSWYTISPKVAVQFTWDSWFRTFLSFSAGFSSPGLDDLCFTGRITNGFKMANPLLETEKINHYEWGIDLKFIKTIKLTPLIYYSIGNDFHGLASNGDTIDTGDEKLFPVYKQVNIGQVKMYGGELNLLWYIHPSVCLTADYSYNYSRIVLFNVSDSSLSDLTGKKLSGISPHLFFAGIVYKNRFLNTTFTFNYKDRQWENNQNTNEIAAYSMVNIRFSKTIINTIQIVLDIQNILDKKYINQEGNLSLGRFIIGEIKIMF